jgi:hypothetical protein
MYSWPATFLGRRHVPREVTVFEFEMFFQFPAEQARISDEHRPPELKLELDCSSGLFA